MALANVDHIDEMILVSLDKWTPDWMNRQFLAAALSRRVPVLYAGQPKYPGRIRDLLSLPRCRVLSEGLKVWELPPWMNTHFEDVHHHRWLARQVKSRILFRRRDSRLRALMVWEPSLVSYLDVVPSEVTCCYFDDFFEGLPSSEEHLARLRDQQAILMARADVIFVTWKGLADRLGVGDRAFLLPHGVDFGYYSRASRNEFPLPSDVPRGRPIVGYAGAINAKVDFDLLDRMAQRLPDWNMVFLGHDLTPDTPLRERFDDLLRRPNVFYLGLKTHMELGAYLQAFDVSMMCYRITEWTRYGLPLKMFQYFATGRPIVSTYLPSLEEYADYVSICTNDEEFIDAVANQKSLDNEERRQARLEFAARNTWDQRARTVLEVLDRQWKIKTGAKR